jgi:hypothetical protein
MICKYCKRKIHKGHYFNGTKGLFDPFGDDICYMSKNYLHVAEPEEEQ